MPKKEENREDIVDPIILAAQIEDPNEDEEDKKLREDMLGTSDTSGKATGSDDDDEETEEDEDPDKSDKPEGKDDDQEEGDDKKPEKKPVEAQDDEEADEESEEGEEEDEKSEPSKKTRKERRQERKEDFLASVRKDNAKPYNRREIPKYDPLDYKDENREFKPEELEKDREMVQAVGYARGADEARYWAEQDKFWSDLDHESKLVSYDPELNFLSEVKPDGSKNESFDPDKAEEINGLYLEFIGFKQYPKRDEQGRVLVDNTGKPIVSHSTVDRTDISYEKFARAEVRRMQRWAEDFADDKVEETKKNFNRQKKNQSVRPGGGKRKTLGAIKPGDISRMSDEEFEKNEDEIDRQINAELGI